MNNIQTVTGHKAETMTSSQQMMSSYEFWNIINQFRIEVGESSIRHDDFVKRVVDECEISLRIFRTDRGRDIQVADLDQDQMMLVGMRESKIVRRKVLSWIKGIEAKAPSLPNFSDPVAAARAWADAKESEQAALARIEADKPKVEFVERYVESHGNKTFREVAKLLSANERQLRAMLVNEKVMYLLNGSWTVYANHLNSGRFHITTGERNGHAFNTIRFTPKGVQWISELWNNK